MATVFDCRSSAVYSLQLVFAALKVVKSLASQVEVCAVCDWFTCSFSCRVDTHIGQVKGVAPLTVTWWIR